MSDSDFDAFVSSVASVIQEKHLSGGLMGAQTAVMGAQIPTQEGVLLRDDVEILSYM